MQNKPGKDLERMSWFVVVLAIILIPIIVYLALPFFGYSYNKSVSHIEKKIIKKLKKQDKPYNNNSITKELLKNDNSESIEVLNNFIKNYPDRAEFYLKRAQKNILNNSKDKDGILYDLNMAIDIDPNNAESYYIRAVVLHKMFKSKRGAITNLDSAIAIDSESYKYYLMQALVYQDSKNYGKSLELFDKALKVDENSEIYFLKGKLYEQMGSPQLALNSYQKAKKLDKNNKDVEDAINKVKRKL